MSLIPELKRQRPGDPEFKVSLVYGQPGYKEKPCGAWEKDKLE